MTSTRKTSPVGAAAPASMAAAMKRPSRRTAPVTASPVQIAFDAAAYHDAAGRRQLSGGVGK